MAEDKDDWLDDLDTPQGTDSSPDQSDLDELFGSLDSPAPAPPPPAEEPPADELDQAAIDALLGGDSAPASPATEPDAAMAAGDDLDQSDIDALLASPQNPLAEQPFPEPDQDEIDKLFAEVDSADTAEETPFPAEESDFQDIFDTPQPATSASQPNIPDFDSDEFSLDVDIPDIPDTMGFGGAAARPETPAAAAEPTVVIPAPPSSTAAVATADASPSGPAKSLALLALLAPLLASRKVRIGAGVGLMAVLLLVAGGLWWGRGGDPEAPTPETAQQEAPAPGPAAEEASAPPSASEAQPEVLPPVTVVEPAAEDPSGPAPAVPQGPSLADLDLSLGAADKELAITLKGTDPNDKPLRYDFVTMPEHGRLAGSPPNLVYIPKADFSGVDQFSVKASNGKLASTAATIRITRQAPAAVPEPPPPSPATAAAPAAPGEEAILARSTTYSINSGHRQTINWKKLWQMANKEPYSPEVQVDILRAPKHGDVRAAKGHSSLYAPSAGFSGTDTLTYRFRLGNRTSTDQTITMRVQRQISRPVFRLQPVAPAYATGDMVVLSATPAGSARLTFRWEQQAGVPVILKPLSPEGTRVSFVAPATFNTIATPTLTFRVTATNSAGLSSSQEVTIHTKSRRNSALWRGGRQDEENIISTPPNGT